MEMSISKGKVVTIVRFVFSVSVGLCVVVPEKQTKLNKTNRQDEEWCFCTYNNRAGYLPKSFLLLE